MVSEALLKALAPRVADVPGCVVECGVYRGCSAAMLCKLFPNRHVHLFDTFSGMPALGKSYEHYQGGEFSDTSIDIAIQTLKECSNFTLHEGLVQDTAAELSEPIAFLHIDVDLEVSTAFCCRRFIPQVSEGGIVLFDDYKSHLCGGATNAINEYAKAVGLTLNPGGSTKAFAIVSNPIRDARPVPASLAGVVGGLYTEAE